MATVEKMLRYVRQEDGTVEKVPVKDSKGNPRYKVRWLDANGKRQSKVFTTEKAAEAYGRKMDVERDNIKAGIIAAPKPEAPLFKDFWTETFWKNHVLVHNKKSEQDSKDKAYRTTLGPILGDKPLDAIGKLDVDAVTSACKARGLMPKSINNILIPLGTALRYAKEAGLIATVPAIKLLKVQKVKMTWGCSKPGGVPDDDEMGRIHEAAEAEPELYAMELLASEAGLRIGEIIATEKSDFDLRKVVDKKTGEVSFGQVTVQRTDYRGHLGPPKGGQSRVVPLTERTAAAVRRVIGHLKGRWAFCDEDGNRWTEQNLDHRILLLGVRAKIPLAQHAYDRERETRRVWKIKQAAKEGRPPSAEQLARIAEYEAEKKTNGKLRWGWHTLRHRYGASLASRGASPRAIQELLGHASIQQTDRYMQAFAPAAARAAVALLEQPSARPAKTRF